LAPWQVRTSFYTERMIPPRTTAMFDQPIVPRARLQGRARLQRIATRLAALVAGLLLAGCEQQETAGEIRLSGTVEAREADLAFQVPGRVLRLLADEGATVEAGQVVAELDPRDYELALQRARAEAEIAAQALAVLEAGTRVQEVRVAEATLRRAESELRFARAEEARVAKLLPAQLASQQQLDQTRLQQQVAESALAQARETLTLLREGSRVEDIARARAELGARRAAVEIAEQQLQYVKLHSPAAGVLSVRLAEAGEVVAAGAPVLRLAELDKPWVRAYLAETDLARVRHGQPAEVRVDAWPDTVFHGRLSFVAPQAEFTPKTVETRELRVDLVYRIKVEVDDAGGRFKVGMPADVLLTPEAAP
jgi:HlyD family secretion protein